MITFLHHSHPRRPGLLLACFALLVFLAAEAPSRGQSPAPGATGSSNPAFYLPAAATVQVAGMTSVTPATGTQTGSANAGIPLSGTGVASTTTASAVALQINSPGIFSPTTLAPLPQPATVTLAYNVACAGLNVLVAPLDGGSINGAPGAQTLTIGANGSLTFSFQAPTGPGHYHVVTRLNGSEIVLPFDVPDPSLPTPAPFALPAGN